MVLTVPKSKLDVVTAIESGLDLNYLECEYIARQFVLVGRKYFVSLILMIRPLVNGDIQCYPYIFTQLHLGQGFPG